MITSNKRLKQQNLIEKLNEFNSVAQKADCRTRIKYEKDDNVYKLFIGTIEQFKQGVYQCKIYEGSLKECYLAVHAMLQMTSFEFKVY